MALRALLASALLAVGLAAVPAPAPAAAVTPQQATALGRQAYVYGFPLLEFLRVRRTNTSVRCPDRVGNAPLNAFSNVPVFADPSERTIVAPNVDTLYSIAQLDLRRGPVVLSHPNMGRRYFVFELLDPYTNVIGYVGQRTTGARAGRFAITWTGRPGRRVKGARVIRSRYRRVWVIGRTLARDGADRRRAVRLMRRYRLSTVTGPRRFAKGCRPGTARQGTTPDGLAFLHALSRAMKDNPPPARDRPQLRRLAKVGVGPGLRPETAGLSPDALRALVASVKDTAAALPATARATVAAQAAANHGWADPSDEIGRYGTDYTYRAGIAEVGLGANTRAEATYPTALFDSQGRFFDGGAVYRMVFKPGGLPPNLAFWSLTMYDGGGFLVPNALHRYAIGSSHPGLVRRKDGSVVVVLARTRPREPGVNWLPAPKGAFRLSLRIYRPKASVLARRWRPPAIVRTSG